MTQNEDIAPPSPDCPICHGDGYTEHGGAGPAYIRICPCQGGEARD
jgi:hypothetical protein